MSSTATRSPIVQAYITSALWSSCDDEGIPLDDEKYAGIEIPEETYEKMRADVGAFITANAEDLLGMASEQIGHDLWLTRNGHGCGFFDRGLGERGERLTKAADALGTQDIYIGDDARLYVM